MTSTMETLQKVLYPVELKPVKKSKDLTAKEGEQDIIRTDTGEVLSRVSSRYSLVSNRDLLMPFIEHFGEARLASCVAKKRAVTIELETGRTFDFGSGDVLKERLVIQNSYDRTRSYRFMFGCMRLVCTNGLYVGVMALQFRKIHVGVIPIQTMVKQVLKEYKSNKFDLWRRMAKVPQTTKQQIQTINRLECLEIDSKDRDPDSQYKNFAINERVKTQAISFVNRPESVDNCKNAWGTLNQVNRAIQAELRGNYLLDKRIHANHMAERYLADKFKLN